MSLSNLSKAAQFFNEHQISDSDQKKGVLEQLEKLTQKEGDKKLFEISGIPKMPKESKGRVSDKEMRVTLILKDEVMDKLERCKGLIHKPKSNSEIFEMTLDISIPYLIKKKFKSLEKS